jgi:hypothetical protein
VEEEADGGMLGERGRGAQEGGEEHQVVVVHPDYREAR